MNESKHTSFLDPMNQTSAKINPDHIDTSRSNN